MTQVLNHEQIRFIIDSTKTNNESIKSMAKACHCSEETIYRFRNVLARRGYLLASGDKFSKRIYWLSNESVENIARDVEKYYYN